MNAAVNSVQSEGKDGVVDAKAEVLGKEKGPGHETLVDAVFDLGLSWAEFGVSQGKQALTHSAKTLERVAKSLDDLQRRLRKD
jgi:hypothetical protein